MKNFQRVIPVVLGGFLLSGCLLPTHFTVASWAIDGISVLFTKKSVTDHGISAIAQKDCALWRGFTEGEVCRDEDSITAIADAGDISNTGKPATTASLAGSATNDGKINAKAVYHNSILSDLAFEDKLMDKPVSWQNDIDNSKFVGVVVSDDVSADVIEIEVLNASDELFADMPMMEVSVDASKTALLYGNYLVIG
ncbi:MAG: hypothetical protein HON65_13920, partial [Rhodospirillales bacterium]|nr:hypothetical protein [Rhodospirillales bacterium]